MKTIIMSYFPINCTLLVIALKHCIITNIINCMLTSIKNLHPINSSSVVLEIYFSLWKKKDNLKLCPFWS